jgi:hypothetical protein
MRIHKISPKRESNRAILAHVKKEMDKPRMSQSAREEEEESQPDHAARVENAAVIQGDEESPAIRAQVNDAHKGEQKWQS